MNSKRGEIPFDADGVSGILCMKTNAMVQYEDVAGEPIFAALSAIEDQMVAGSVPDIPRIRRIFWAICPQAETEVEAGDLIDALGMAVAINLISEAVQAAFPKEPATAPTRGKPRQPRKSPAAR